VIKLLEIIARRADLTHEAFIEHQLTTHLKVVAQVPEFVAPVRRYMQNHLILDAATLEALPGLPIATNTDSVIEVWYDGLAAIQKAFQEPRYMEVIRPDELSFGDVQSVWGIAATEVAVWERYGSTGALKLFVFMKRASGLYRSQFKALWQSARERLTQLNGGFSCICRFVENWTAEDLGDQLPGMKNYDLVAEMWFSSLTELARLCRDPEVEALFLKSNFLHHPDTLIYVARERPESAEWLRRQQQQPVPTLHG
jgi:hypothetical protein